MEIIHKFNTNDPNDVALHNHHHYAEDYYCALVEIIRYVRSMYKHENLRGKEYKAVERIYQMICHNVEGLDI